VTGSPFRAAGPEYLYCRAMIIFIVRSSEIHSNSESCDISRYHDAHGQKNENNKQFLPAFYLLTFTVCFCTIILVHFEMPVSILLFSLC